MKKHRTLQHQVTAGKFNIDRVKCYIREKALPAPLAVTGPNGLLTHSPLKILVK